MKSVKPGRGASRMGFIASLAISAFGVLWTVFAAFLASRIGPIAFVFPLFGIIFVGLGIYQAVYNYKNYKGKNRMSVFDITEGSEEPDPFSPGYGEERVLHSGRGNSYCPYCRSELSPAFAFCPRCGKSVE
jgi:hypothetical protein